MKEFLLVLWLDITEIDKHTHDIGTNRLTHTDNYTLMAPAMCTQVPVLHWMNNLLIQKFTWQRSIMYLLSRKNTHL